MCKRKKTRYFFIIALIVIGLLIAYIFRPMTMNDLEKEPNFIGTVTKVYEKSILVAIDQTQEAYKSGDLASVSLSTKLKDSTTDFSVGDRVKVYYDGYLQESYPLGVSDVYAIILMQAE